MSDTLTVESKEYVSASNGTPTVVDNTKEFLNDNTPSLIFNFVPEEFLEFGNNKNMLNHLEISQVYSNLPRLEDGSLDIKRISEARDIAIKYIKQKNKEASQKINYGVYKENLDSPKALSFVFGPEVAYCLEKKTPIKSDIRLGANDLTNELSNYLENPELKDLADNVTIKPAHVIRDNIKKQNEALDNLLHININTQEGMMQLLEQYALITGTNFSCEAIEKAVTFNGDNSNANGHDKLYNEAEAFGLMENFTDATKNKIATDTAFNIARNVSTRIVGKIPTLPTKIVSLAMPTIILANEKITEGAGEDEIINVDNLTYKNFVDIASQGAVEGIFAQCNTSLLPDCENGFRVFKPMAEKGARFGLKQLSTKAAKTAIEVTVPNWEDKSNLLELLLPGQHCVRSIYNKFFN